MAPDLHIPIHVVGVKFSPFDVHHQMPSDVPNHGFTVGHATLSADVKTGKSSQTEFRQTEKNTSFAEYSSFVVGNETEKYKLRVGGFSGTAGDSLSYHRGFPFTTKDNDNDGWSSGNCALTNKGAWWYDSCYKSSLNGQYMPGALDTNPGMNWYYWKNSWISMKRTEMKIRPKRF
ncbi:PREDICTED: fibrinogen-like protein 1 [Acropora digitifera]|uniref:fibrinogen-like protein 1 n=1 Tax=Acropora digitifera TaxID=70779 RepID=UPI000779FED0|nr:PREDICTED: fibrinogen-like protein 1 [Acropora digitifera]